MFSVCALRRGGITGNGALREVLAFAFDLRSLNDGNMIES